MTLSLRSITTAALGAIAWLFFVGAGLAFLFGGGLIHALVGTERTTAELEGVALTVLCAGVGTALKIVQYRLEEGELPAGLGEALRK